MITVEERQRALKFPIHLILEESHTFTTLTNFRVEYTEIMYTVHFTAQKYYVLSVIPIFDFRTIGF